LEKTGYARDMLGRKMDGKEHNNVGEENMEKEGETST